MERGFAILIATTIFPARMCIDAKELGEINALNNSIAKAVAHRYPDLTIALAIEHEAKCEGAEAAMRKPFAALEEIAADVSAGWTKN
jgi:hypothetical protein